MMLTHTCDVKLLHILLDLMLMMTIHVRPCQGKVHKLADAVLQRWLAMLTAGTQPRCSQVEASGSDPEHNQHVYDIV